MQAEAIMTKPVITTDANATIAEAVELMLSNKVSCLPVIDSDGVLVGIVSKATSCAGRNWGLSVCGHAGWSLILARAQSPMTMRARTDGSSMR